MRRKILTISLFLLSFNFSCYAQKVAVDRFAKSAKRIYDNESKKISKEKDRVIKNYNSTAEVPLSNYETIDIPMFRIRGNAQTILDLVLCIDKDKSVLFEYVYPEFFFWQSYVVHNSVILGEIYSEPDMKRRRNYHKGNNQSYRAHYIHNMNTLNDSIYTNDTYNRKKELIYLIREISPEMIFTISGIKSYWCLKNDELIIIDFHESNGPENNLTIKTVDTFLRDYPLYEFLWTVNQYGIIMFY